MAVEAAAAAVAEVIGVAKALMAQALAPTAEVGEAVATPVYSDDGRAAVAVAAAERCDPPCPCLAPPCAARVRPTLEPKHTYMRGLHARRRQHKYTYTLPLLDSRSTASTYST